MHRPFLRLLCACVLLLVAGPGTAADKPVLSAVTDPSFVPFETLDRDSGKMVGFDMDILQEVARRAGFEYRLRTMSFSGIIPALQTGSVDIAIAGITITAKRARVVDFSAPYYDSGLRLLVRSDNTSIHALEDLPAKRVACKIGSTSFDFLQQRVGGGGTTVIPYPGTADMYLALLSGSVDAVLYDAPNVGYFANTRGKGRVKTVGPLYQGQQYGIALAKGSPWRQAIDKALRAMRADGSYRRIHAQWFGSAPGSNAR